MAIPAPIASGEILHVREVRARFASLDGRSVRVIGAVASHDAAAHAVRIRGDDGAMLRVDCALLGEVPLRTGALFQFIGEVEANAEARSVTE